MSKIQYIYGFRQEEFNKFFKKNWFRKKPLDVLEVENGYILPPKGDMYQDWQVGLSKPTMGNGGVVDSKENFIDFSACRVEHLIQESALTRDRFGGKYSFERKNVDFRDETVIYCGIFWKQWGHFLIDQITRLWFVINHMDKDYKLVWVIGNECEKPISGNYQQIIELLGLDTNRMEFVNKITQYKRIIVPEPANYSGRYYTKEYNHMMDIIIQNAMKQYCGNFYEKVYFSRVKFSKNSFMEIGEEAIEKVFRENGFEVIYPEEVDTISQIALINKCEIFASLEGTVAHNSLFMSKGKKQIVINRNRIINPFQFQINAMRRLETIFIDAWSEIIEPISLKNKPGAFWRDPSFISINEMIEKFIHDNGFQTISTVDNVRISFKNNLKIRISYFNILYLKKWKVKIKRLMKKI